MSTNSVLFERVCFASLPSAVFTGFACWIYIYIYIYVYICVGIKYITLIGTTSEAYQLALFHQLSSQRIYLCYFVVPSTPRSGRIRLPRSHNRDYYGITVTEIVDWDTCTRMSKSIALKATYRYFNILYTLILLPILPIVITKQTRLKTRWYGMRSNIFIASSWCFQSTICHFCIWINFYQLCNKLIIQYVYIYIHIWNWRYLETVDMGFGQQTTHCCDSALLHGIGINLTHMEVTQCLNLG